MTDRPKRRRPAPLSLRLTPEDRSRLEHDAGGLALGAYIRWRLGKPAKEIVARFGNVEDLRSVEETKALIAAVIAPRMRDFIKEVDNQRSVAMAALNARRLEKRDAHRTERTRLDQGQAERRVGENRMRSARLRRGVMGVWDCITGEYAKTRKLNEAEAFVSFKRDRSQRDDLVRGQLDGLIDQLRGMRNLVHPGRCIVDRPHVLVDAAKRLGQTEVLRETHGKSTSTTTSKSASQSRTENAGWSTSSGRTQGQSDMADLQRIATRDGGNGLMPFIARAGASGAGHSVGQSNQEGRSGGKANSAVTARRRVKARRIR